VQDNSATHTEFKDDKQSDVLADNNLITVHGLDGNYMNKSKWPKLILAEEINTSQGRLGVLTQESR
jgi:predicted DNA-binding protein (MmcQ/YjbR family)